MQSLEGAHCSAASCRAWKGPTAVLLLAEPGRGPLQCCCLQSLEGAHCSADHNSGEGSTGWGGMSRKHKKKRRNPPLLAGLGFSRYMSWNFAHFPQWACSGLRGAITSRSHRFHTAMAHIRSPLHGTCLAGISRNSARMFQPQVGDPLAFSSCTVQQIQHRAWATSP